MIGIFVYLINILIMQHMLMLIVSHTVNKVSRFTAQCHYRYVYIYIYVISKIRPNMWSHINTDMDGSIESITIKNIQAHTYLINDIHMAITFTTKWQRDNYQTWPDDWWCHLCAIDTVVTVCWWMWRYGVLVIFWTDGRNWNTDEFLVNFDTYYNMFCGHLLSLTYMWYCSTQGMGMYSLFERRSLPTCPNWYFGDETILFYVYFFKSHLNITDSMISLR